MDTDELSEETYKAIIIESDLYKRGLTLQFGLLSGECKNEEEYIHKSLLLIEEMKAYDEIDLDDMFFGNPPNIKEFQLILSKIVNNIESLKKTPLNKRTFFDD